MCGQLDRNRVNCRTVFPLVRPEWRCFPILPVAVSDEKMMFGTCKRDVQKPSLIIYCFALCVPGKVFVFRCGYDDRFRGKTLGAVHREDVDLASLDFLLNCLRSLLRLSLPVQLLTLHPLPAPGLVEHGQGCLPLALIYDNRLRCLLN